MIISTTQRIQTLSARVSVLRARDGNKVCVHILRRTYRMNDLGGNGFM